MDSDDHPYIAIEGVIGVGKTTLARLLQPRFRSGTILEAFDENPFLSDFYGDRARYAFQTQLFFLLSRYRQQQTAPERLHQGAVLADYAFEKDRLFAHLNITGADELEMYDRLYAALAEKVQPPDLIVYLRAHLDTLMARIAMRDRTYERQMDRDYIAALRNEYERLFASYTATPLLVIDSDTLDFVRNPEDLDVIEQRIRAALAGVRQPTLPRIRDAGVPVAPQRPLRDLVATQAADGRDAGLTSSELRSGALTDFLALAEAVGRVGGALSQLTVSVPGNDTTPLRRALQDAGHALGAMAKLLDAQSGASDSDDSGQRRPGLELLDPREG